MNSKGDGSLPRVPRFAARLLVSRVPVADREAVLSDMLELYVLQRIRQGRLRSWLWYWKQAISFPIRLIVGEGGKAPFAKHPNRRGGGRHQRPVMTEVASTLVQDLRYAVRGFVRAPGFTVTAVLTIALGVGANSAVFSVINSVVLRPLPFADPDRIVRVWVEQSVTAREMQALERRSESYSAIAAVSSGSFTLTGEGRPEELSGSVVGTQHFEVFSTVPALGTGFHAEHSRPDGSPVVVLSHEFWERRFGADPDVVGRTYTIGGEGAERRTVLGVMPPGYKPFSHRSDVYVPLVYEPGTNAYTDMQRYEVVGRLRPEIGVTAARAELQTVLLRMLEGEEGQYIDREAAAVANVLSYHESQIESVAGTLWILLAAVAVVLVIASTNVANLLLARAGAREREMAVRTAIGAGRGRLIRQLLTENTLLGLVGGGVGFVAAALVLPALVANLPPGVPLAGDIGVDTRVLGFTIVVSLLAGIAFGWAPAVRSTSSVDAVLRDGGRTNSVGRRRFRLNAGLVAVEVALCVVLVTAAGLLGRSLWNLVQVQPGFAAEGLYSIRVAPSVSTYPEEDDRRLYYRQALEQVAAVPGVRSTGAIQVLPMTTGHMGVAISRDGLPVPDGERPQVVGYRVVTPGYMETMQIPLLEGRQLAITDRTGGAAVGLINEKLANLLWPDESAVGREVRYSDGSMWFTVVGVVANVHQHSLAMASRTEVYLPYEQDAWIRGLFIMFRSSTGADIMESVRQAVWEVDPDVPVSREASMLQVIDESTSGARFYTLLFSLFAGLALMLGGIGVFGVTSYTVAQRTHDIGIRLALGAERPQVVRTTLQRSMMPVIAGLVLGAAGALGVTRLLSSLLFEVKATDPLVFTAALLGLGLMAALATLLPARRAASVDPIISLQRG